MRRMRPTERACVIGALAVCQAAAGGGFEGFAPPETYSVGDNPVATAAGDIDNNGTADLAIANEDDNTVSVLFGLGDGTFAPPATLSTTENPIDVRLSDIDNDGNLDLVVLSEFVAALDTQGAISVHLDQDGLFAPPTVYRMRTFSTVFELVDLNGDGLEDAVTADGSDGTVSVRLGNADGTFGARLDYPAGLTPRALALGDVTGDGVPDVVVNSGQFTPRYYVLAGLGDGTLGAPQFFTVPSAVYDLALADLNGDGLLDFLGGTGSQQVHVRLGIAGGDFAPAETLTFDGAGSISDLLCIDLNGDSFVDIAAPDLVGVVLTRLGNGDGTFQAHQPYACGSFPASITYADFDGNDSPDLVVPNPGSDHINVLINQTSFPPGAFALLAPADGAKGLPLPEAVAGWSPAALRWEASTSFPTYRVEIATDSEFLATVFDTDGVSGTSVDVPLGVLAPSTRYYWRVTASTAGGDTASTPAYATFTTTQAADLNSDGVIDATDLAALIAFWSP